MKRILLASTALMAVALAGPAMAQTNTAVSNAPFTVKISGYDNSTFAVIGEKRDSNLRSYDFRNQMRLQIVGEAKADNGLVYGINVRLNIGTAGLNGSQNAVTADRSYAYAYGNFGAVRAGEHDTIAHDWFGWVSDNYVGWGPGTGDTFGPGGGLGSGDGNAYIASGQAVSLENIANHFGYDTFGTGRNFTKLSYYTPKFSGFQAGISFAPDNNGRRAFDRNDVYDAPITAGTLSFGNNYKNLTEVALRYENKFDDLYVFAGVGANFAQSKDAALVTQRKLNDIAEAGLNVRLNYLGFGFQGAFNYAGDSGLTKRLASDAVYQTSDAMGGFVEASYRWGPYAVAANYATARGPGSVLIAGKETYNAAQVGGHYRVAPGFLLFSGLTFYRAKTDSTYVAGSANGINNKNDATVFELGSQIIF